jgi:hypothetical protein
VPDFQPHILELTQRGATAALLLEAQQELCGQCVETVLRRIDDAIVNDRMTPAKALQWVAEIAAYRRIVFAQQQIVQQGKAARNRLMEEPAGHV